MRPLIFCLLIIFLATNLSGNNLSSSNQNPVKTDKVRQVTNKDADIITNGLPNGVQDPLTDYLIITNYYADNFLIQPDTISVSEGANRFITLEERDCFYFTGISSG